MEGINATDFEARCLAILDQVRDTGEHVVILKRDRPVAELSPPTASKAVFPQLELAGPVAVVGDIVGPPFRRPIGKPGLVIAA